MFYELTGLFPHDDIGMQPESNPYYNQRKKLGIMVADNNYILVHSDSSERGAWVPKMPDFEGL